MTDDAIAHLRAAIELRPGFRDFAKEDADFDPVRDDPRFQELRKDLTHEGSAGLCAGRHLGRSVVLAFLPGGGQVARDLSPATAKPDWRKRRG